MITWLPPSSTTAPFLRRPAWTRVAADNGASRALLRSHTKPHPLLSLSDVTATLYQCGRIHTLTYSRQYQGKARRTPSSIRIHRLDRPMSSIADQLSHLVTGDSKPRMNSEDEVFVGSIDQGTTSTRFLIFDKSGEPVAIHQEEFSQIYPRPGWVASMPCLFSRKG